MVIRVDRSRATILMWNKIFGISLLVRPRRAPGTRWRFSREWPGSGYHIDFRHFVVSWFPYGPGADRERSIISSTDD